MALNASDVDFSVGLCFFIDSVNNFTGTRVIAYPFNLPITIESD
jgi:hypothetical protein